MLVGFARRSITPRGSVALAGFDLRNESSKGVLDEIYVTALALKSGSGEALLMCGFDLLGVPLAFCERLRQAIYEKYALPGERVLVSATHTHAAPGAVFLRHEGDEDYVRLLISRTLEAAGEALDGMRPAKASAGCGFADGVASYRDRPRELSKYSMPLFKLGFSGDAPAELIRFSCHCTVLNEKNALISRDLAGAAEAQSKNGARCLMLNGACADLSTRFTRLESGEGELKRLGKLMAESCEKLEMKPLDNIETPILCTKKRFKLPLGAAPDGALKQRLVAAHTRRVEECADAVAVRESRSILAVLSRPPKAREEFREVEAAAIDFGAFTLLGLPFEMNSDEGEQLERKLSAERGKPVYVVCYTGGYDGYLPSGKPIDENSNYQDIASIYAPEAIGIIGAQLDMLSKELNNGRQVL